MKDETREDRWAELETIRQDGPKRGPLHHHGPYFVDGDDDRHRSALQTTKFCRDDEPFVLLMVYLEMGVRPPNELLFWLRDRWFKFLDAAGGAGEVDLETALVGSSKEPGRRGSLATRISAKAAELNIAIKFLEFYRQGMPKWKAASETVNELKLPISPEAVLKKPEVKSLIEEHGSITARDKKKNASTDSFGKVARLDFQEK